MWREVFGVWYEVTFGGLEASITRCTDELWLTSMWDVSSDPAQPRALAPDGSPHPLGNNVLSAVWKVAWHGLAANEFNMYGRQAGFRTSYIPEDPSWVAAQAVGFGAPAGEVVPREPPSREEVVAYLQYNRRLVDMFLAIAREDEGGESTLGQWRGATSLLLSMFHGNACHLVSHATEVGMFVNQHR
ncbi:MAG: hypothetical protein QOD30_709 [Actinomycetota bacterium]|nr:hypothetical protein [Actinomycetota bacterium]